MTTLCVFVRARRSESAQVLSCSAIGGNADQRVGKLVGQARIHSDFGIDPPKSSVTPSTEQATVYVVALDDQELERLRRDLRTAFTNSVEEVATDPAVVTQLADIGQVAIHGGVPAAPLEPLATNGPRLALEAKSEEESGEEPSSEPPAVTPERKNSGPAHFHDRITKAPIPNEDEDDLVAESEPRDGAARRDEKRLNVVLVWVTTRSR